MRPEYTVLREAIALSHGDNARHCESIVGVWDYAPVGPPAPGDGSGARPPDAGSSFTIKSAMLQCRFDCLIF